MKASDVVALGSTVVAIGALILTAYLARLNLHHQRIEAHRGRIWERKADAAFELLEWLEAEAASDELGTGNDAIEFAPRVPVSVYVRLDALTPSGFMEQIASALLAVGKMRKARMAYGAAEATRGDLDAAWAEANRQLTHVRDLVRNEVKLVPFFAEKVTPLRLGRLPR
jgi:hypothetical protein